MCLATCPKKKDSTSSLELKHIPPNRRYSLCPLSKYLPAIFYRRTSKVSSIQPGPVNAFHCHRLKASEIESQLYVSHFSPGRGLSNPSLNNSSILYRYCADILQLYYYMYETNPLTCIWPVIYFNLKWALNPIKYCTAQLSESHFSNSCENCMKAN